MRYPIPDSTAKAKPIPTITSIRLSGLTKRNGNRKQLKATTNKNPATSFKCPRKRASPPESKRKINCQNHTAAPAPTKKSRGTDQWNENRSPSASRPATPSEPSIPPNAKAVEITSKRRKKGEVDVVILANPN